MIQWVQGVTRRKRRLFFIATIIVTFFIFGTAIVYSTVFSVKNPWLYCDDNQTNCVNGSTVYFNETYANLQYLVSNNETDPYWTGNSSSVARIGDCPSGFAVQNTTTGGVQCVNVSFYDTDTNETGRVNNIVRTNCTGQVIAGFYSNGTGWCEPDNTGGVGSYSWKYDTSSNGTDYTVPDGSTVRFAAGANMVVNHAGNTITFASNGGEEYSWLDVTIITTSTATTNVSTAPQPTYWKNMT